MAIINQLQGPFRFWSAHDLSKRRFISSSFTRDLEDVFVEANQSWRFIEIEAPLYAHEDGTWAPVTDNAGYAYEAARRYLTLTNARLPLAFVQNTKVFTSDIPELPAYKNVLTIHGIYGAGSTVKLLEAACRATMELVHNTTKVLVTSAKTDSDAIQFTIERESDGSKQAAATIKKRTDFADENGDTSGYEVLEIIFDLDVLVEGS